MAGLAPFNNRRKYLLSNSGLDFFNMIDDFYNDSWLTGRYPQGTFKIDVKENEKDYIIEAELPGIKKEEINLNLDESFLTISVEREENVNEDRENYIHRERRLTSMSRGVHLVDAKAEDIKAKLENGILFITVQKKDVSKGTQKIDIE